MLDAEIEETKITELKYNIAELYTRMGDNDNAFESYKKYMNSLAEKYDIPVEDEIPLFENQYFTDNSHLNDEGAKILTAMWREKYKALLE